MLPILLFLAGFAVAAAPDEVVLIGGPDKQVYRYAPEPQAWLPHSIAQTPRQYHAAVRLGNSAGILVCGGLMAGSNVPLSSCEIWKSSSGTWTLISTNMLIQRGNPSSGPPQLILLDNGNVLALFGNTSMFTTETLDPTGFPPSWMATSSVVVQRKTGASATKLSTGQILVCGGVVSSAIVPSCEFYDPAIRSWSSTGSMTTPRANHAALLLPNGNVLVVGGDSAGTFFGEIYNPNSHSWTSTSLLSTGPRLYPGLAMLNNTPCVIGGRLFTSTATSIECLNLATQVWSNTSTLFLPEPLYNFPLTLTPPPFPVALIAGGSSFSTALGDSMSTNTYIYNMDTGMFVAGGTFPPRLTWTLVVAPAAAGTCAPDTTPATSVDHSDCARALLDNQTCNDVCSTGYSLLQGNATRTCHAGVLDASVLTCSPTPCPQPDPSSGITTCNGQTPSGSNCSESCASGYRAVSGSGDRLCTAGALAPRTLTCIQTCPPDNTSAANGVTHLNCNLFLDEGQTCNDQCSDGYGSPQGATIRTCSGGVLSSSALTCSSVSVSCPQPDNTTGIVTCNGTTASGSYCNETCDSNYLQTSGCRFGGQSRLCTAGTLTPRTLTCALYCPPPVPPQGIQTCNFPTTEGLVCHEDCAPGYRQTSGLGSGGANRVCISGSLTNSTLTCIQTCPADNTALTNGVIHADCNRSLDEGATCNDICLAGNAPSGVGTRTCSGGVLNASTLVCVPRSCSQPTATPEIVTCNGATSSGSNCFETCAPGYVQTVGCGGENRTCSLGVLAPRTLVCTPSCPFLPPTEGIVTCDDIIAPGSFCHETCAPGYQQTSGGSSGDDLFCSSVGILSARNLACTRLMLNISQSLSQYGEAVNLTATISISNQFPLSNGQATFKLVGSAQALGTAPFIAGVAMYTFYSSFSLSQNEPYQIVATYQTVTSNVVTLGITQGQTATSLNSSSNPTEFTEGVTFTIRVQSSSASPSAPAGLLTSPTGNVLLLNNGQVLAQTLLSLKAGVTTFSTSAFTVGLHQVHALYLGDSNYLQSDVQIQQSVITVVPIFEQYTTQTGSQHIGKLTLRFPLPIPSPLKITTTITPSSPGFSYPTNLKFTGANFAYAPKATGVTGTSISASQQITFTFNSLPSSIPTPIYIYASNWPADTYVFSTTIIQRSPAKSNKVTITNASGKSTLVVQATGAPFSGIFEVSGSLSASKAFSWQGTKAQKLVYALATSGGSH